MSERYKLIRLAAIALLLTSLPGIPPSASETVRPLLDPTRPSGWQANAPAETASSTTRADALRLQGTYQAAGHRSAMISGRRVTVGDEIGGAQVIAIGKNKVSLLVEGEAIELAASIPAVKAPVEQEGEDR